MEQRDFDLDPAQWATLRRLLDEALERDPSQRAVWLDSLDGPLAEFKPRLRALLEQDAATSHRRMHTLPKVETADFAPAPLGAMPERIGPYRLLRELGSGGMASVWLAERTDMLQGRQVALKLPHGDWGAYGARGDRGLQRRAGLAERLAREREILATLNHPNIARLYDAGVADDGQPYLALEYVEGERIDAYCTRHQLDVPARLRLFMQAARAVAHAHANLVVHRDLKPSNILVNAQGEVRLLDFGIAKLLDQGQAVETELTQQAGRALTPDYASPEQVRGEPIGTASDVYSLGVVLYELLTGMRPYRLEHASRAALEEAILRAEPKRPSAAIDDKRLQRSLRGDLDTIVLKALEKQAPRRYPTVDAMADDVQRHLDQRPVLAQPDSGAYRLGKFISRNRLATAAVTGVIAAVIVGAALATWQAREALAQARRAEEVKAFIASIFEDANPWSGPQTKPTAAELLQRATQRLEQRFADRPLIRMELLNTVAASLVGLQEFAAAEGVLRDALALGARELSTDDAQAIRSRMLLLDLHLASGKTDALKTAVDAVLPLLERAPTHHAVELPTALLRAAEVANHEGRTKDMEQLARRSLGLVEQHLPAAHPLRTRAQIKLANALENLGDGAQSRQVSQQALESAERLYADQPQHPELAEIRFIHGRIIDRAGDWRASLPHFERAIADTQAVFGEDSLRVATILRTMVTPLVTGHRLADALAASERSLSIMRRQYAADSVHLAYAFVAHASIHAALRQPTQAFEHYDRALAILRPALGEDKQYLLHVRALRAGAMAQTGHAGEAVDEMADVVPRHLRAGEPGLWVSVLSQAVVLRLAGRHEQALVELDLHAARAVRPQHSLRLNLERGLNLLALGRAVEALAPLEAAAAVSATADLPMIPERADLALALGRALRANGRASEAQPLLRKAHDFWQAHAPQSRWATEAATALAEGAPR